MAYMHVVLKMNSCHQHMKWHQQLSDNCFRNISYFVRLVDWNHNWYHHSVRRHVARSIPQMDSQQRKINEFYPWSAESNLTNQFILCLDNNAFSGDFILNETIIKLLRDSQNVYLISTNHSRNHYEAIFKKNVCFCRHRSLPYLGQVDGIRNPSSSFR